MGDRTPAPDPPPDCSAALSGTRLSLECRSARYRNLVVCVSLIGLAALIAALALWSPRPLLAWLLIVPVCGSFLIRDARAVARWRADLLEGWVAGTLDLDALREGLTSIKILPAATIAGMVDPLPTRARLQCFPDPKPLVRAALAATVLGIDRALIVRTAVAALALTVTIVLVAVAAAIGSWWPLVGLPLSFAHSIAARRIGSRPSRSWLRTMTSCRDRGLNPPQFTELAARLAWDSLPPGSCQNWLSHISEKN